MAAIGVGNCAVPQPNRLLFLAAFPPVDSIIERLGRRRQSSSYRSAASMKASAYCTAGQSKRRKNDFNFSNLGSFLYSALGAVGTRGATAKGAEIIPESTTNPLDNNLLILENSSI